MTPEDRPRRSLFAVWRWPRWIWFVSVPLLLAAYPFSIGPAVWLVEKGYLSDSTTEVLGTAYLPMLITAETVPPLEHALEQYLEWWTPPEAR